MGNREIRDVLLGRIVRQDEQVWTVVPSGVKLRFHGVRDGEGDVRLFGVTHRMHNYQIAQAALTEALAEAETALSSMGKAIHLASMPQAKACLYAPGWIAPVLLTMERNGDELQIAAYSGRSLLIGRLRCRVALWILERRLPATISYVGKGKKEKRKDEEKKEPLKKAEKNSSRKKKKASKQEKSE